MIKAILFDIGGVLIENPPDKIYGGYAKLIHEDPEKAQDRLKNVLAPCETGKISSEEFWSRGAKRFGIKKKIFRKVWIKGIENSKPYKQVWKLAGILEARGYKLAILTNAIAADVSVPIIKKVYSRFYPDVFKSFALGCKKPSEKIYRIVLKKLELKPREVVFVDNHEENVDGARKVGMIGIHFTSYRKFVKDLKKLSVI